MTKYSVSVPYWFHAIVEADSEKEALDKFHEDGGASMGEYDDDRAVVEIYERGGV